MQVYKAPNGYRVLRCGTGPGRGAWKPSGRGLETPGELDLDRRPRESAHGRARTHFREGSEARPVPWSGQVCTAECAPGRRSGPRPAPLGLRLLRPDQQAGGRQPSASLRVRGRAGLAQPLAALVRARGGSRVPHSAAAARPMAPQRRGAPKGPEGCGAAERGRPNSTKGVRAPRDVRRKWLRVAVLGACTTLAGLLLWGRLGADKDGIAEVLAGRSEVLPGRFIEVPCSEDYDSQRRFEGCTPRKCGRGVSDAVITRDEARRIRSIAEKGLSLGGSDGGASILDLHSGALSVGKHFVNLYRYFGDKIQNIFSEEDFRLYRNVRQKVQLAIAQAFGISASSLHLTKPTFFSRINSTAARTAHDEYWHAHVDKVTYGSFDYTSLLYLSDYQDDFGGGRFVFMEEGANRTVEPRAGRVRRWPRGTWAASLPGCCVYCVSGVATEAIGRRRQAWPWSLRSLQSGFLEMPALRPPQFLTA
uniref:Prolyl 4-hydroxylase alpha subunit domain-containing protein n=1 Tax=Sus scrofa TaxID=9823 RepID=A0A8D1H7H3_PIG